RQARRDRLPGPDHPWHRGRRDPGGQGRGAARRPGWPDRTHPDRRGSPRGQRHPPRRRQRRDREIPARAGRLTVARKERHRPEPQPAWRHDMGTAASIRVQLGPARVTTMTEQAREVQGGGTWGPREAAEEWRRGAAARLQAFGPATEMMLDLARRAAASTVSEGGPAA